MPAATIASPASPAAPVRCGATLVHHRGMIAVLLLFGAASASGAEKIKSGDWHLDDNWSPTGVPTPTQGAKILANTSVGKATRIAGVELDAALSIGGDEGSLAVGGGLLVGSDYNTAGSLVVSSKAATPLTVGSHLQVGPLGQGRFEVSRGSVAIGLDLRVGVGVDPFRPGYEGHSVYGELDLHGPETVVSARSFGLGSYPSNANRLGVGEASIRDGAVLRTYGGALTNGAMTIQGTGSRWQQAVTNVNGARDVFVESRLDISNGGELSFAYASGGLLIYGQPSVASRGVVTVNGTGSRIDLSGRLELGRTNASGGELSVGNGATVRSGTGRITEFGEATFSGAGSRWQVDGLLDMYNGKSDSFLNIVNGGQVLAQSLKAGYSGTGPAANARLTITGAGSQLFVAGAMDLGIQGANGGKAVLDIGAGGSVVSVSASVGQQSRAGAEVQVRGAGSTWSVADGLTVGTMASGRVQLAEGGTLNARTVALGGTANDRDFRAAAGTLVFGGLTTAVGAGRLSIAEAVHLANSGKLVFNHTDSDFRFDAVMASNLPGDGLIEQRAGTTRLVSDLSAFTGPTHVLGGKLLVDSVLGSALVTVEAGATLGGTGSLLGSVLAMPGAVISPGNSPGTLHVAGNFTLQAGATLLMELAGSAAGAQHDQLDVTGGLSLAGGQLALRFIDGFAPRADQEFVLFRAGGSFVPAGSVEVSGLLPGWSYSTRFDPGTGTLALLSMSNAVSAVPEPDRAWLLFGGLAVMGWHLRRRRGR